MKQRKDQYGWWQYYFRYPTEDEAQSVADNSGRTCKLEYIHFKTSRGDSWPDPGGWAVWMLLEPHETELPLRQIEAALRGEAT